MRIRQHSYFAIVSRQVHPDAISERLGLRADSSRVRASGAATPPRPTAHWWMVTCDSPRPVDEQVAEIVDRLAPIQDDIGRLVDELVATEGGGAGSVLKVARYFDDPDGEEEVERRAGDAVTLPGQHQLLGWCLDRRTLDFMAATRATLDVDEYG